MIPRLGDGVCACMVEHLGYDVMRVENCERECRYFGKGRYEVDRVIPCGLQQEIYAGPPKPGIIARFFGRQLHKRVVRVASFNTENNSVALMIPQYAIRFKADGMTMAYIVEPDDRYVIVRWNGLWDASDIMKPYDADHCFDETCAHLASFMVTGGEPVFPLFRNKIFQVV
jgi:hypothetical protein